MRLLKFSGSSDDILCVEETQDGKPCGGDETYVSGNDTAAFKVANDHAGLFVVGTYAPDITRVGCWSVGVSPLDEDVGLPDWPMRFEMASNGYSPSLVIEAPANAYVSAMKDED